jgi:transposase
MEADEEKRSLYLKNLAQIKYEDRVYIDESGMDRTSVKERGWGKKGELLKSTKSGKYYLRTNVIAGLRNKKAIAPFVFQGACNTELMNEWVEKFLIKELQPGQTVILDNASFHKSERTKELIESVGCKLLFLPAYSPDLNSIEKFWANMKRWVKNKVTNNMDKLFEIICEYFMIPNSC